MTLMDATLFGTTDKVEKALMKIREYEPPEGYYVAFSGGKDSIVIKDLTIRAGVKADYNYHHTTVDPPELVNYIKQEHPDVTTHYPEISMWKLIVKKGMPPTRIVRYCCSYLKERGGKGRRVMTGVRWSESRRRAKRKMIEVCAKGGGRTFLHPIINWTDGEVWEYIKTRKLKYCCLYDEGFARLGCVGCPCQTHYGMKRDFYRWPKYKKAYISAFDKMLKKKREDGKDSNVWRTGKDVFDWWISGKRAGPDRKNQITLFE